MFWYLLCHPLPQNYCLSSRTYRHRGLKSSLSLAASSWALRAAVEDSVGLYGLYGVLPKCGNINELLRYLFLQWVGAHPHFSMRKLTPKEIKSFAQYHRAIWWQCHITRACYKGPLTGMVTAVFYTSIANQVENMSSIKNQISEFGPYPPTYRLNHQWWPFILHEPQVLIYRPGTSTIIHLPHRTKLK